MSQIDPSPAVANPRRFRWRRLVQFRLRTVLIVMTIIALALGWWSHKARQQREAIAELDVHCKENGQFVLVYYSNALPLNSWMAKPPVWPDCVWETVDMNYIAHPIEAKFLSETFFTPEELDRFHNSLPNCKFTGRYAVVTVLGEGARK